MTDTTDEASPGTRRIEAAITGAQINAKAHGGDVATAAADLMCAFVLLSVKSGADPERAFAAMWEDVKAAVAGREGELT